MDDCIFCNLRKGKIPGRIIWEDEKFLVFLAIPPFAKGHTLVIPKKHLRWVWDLEEKDYLEYMLAVKKTVDILKRAFDTDCVQEFIAGMEVPHAHVHLIPRTKNDGLDEIPKKPLDPKSSDREMDEIRNKIIACI